MDDRRGRRLRLPFWKCALGASVTAETGIGMAVSAAAPAAYQGSPILVVATLCARSCCTRCASPFLTTAVVRTPRGRVIRLGIVGLGRMGLSHLAIANMHPQAKVVAACDSTAYIGSFLGRYTGLNCYSSLERMLDAETLDAVIIATPSKLHAHMVHTAIERDLHVFCEKPFVLSVVEGEPLVAMAEAKSL